MKIGLAVCYDTKNFGSQLQVLATVRQTEALGHTPEIIRYRKKMTPAFALRSLPRLLNPGFVRGKLTGRRKRKQIAAHPEVAQAVARRNQRFEQFVDRQFGRYLSAPYNGWDALVRQGGAAYEAFLCGSDQLWLPSNLGSHFYTLEFAPADKPKIAYATSFGVGQIPWYQKSRTAAYLRRFQSLSTREVRGAALIRGLTGIDAPVVCDPTLLMDAADWAELIPDEVPDPAPYVFCYFLGTNPEHRRAATEFGKSTGLPLVSCPFLDNFVEGDMTFADQRLTDMDAADFVNRIRHAAFVLTDSFHGTVFSILHHKQFLTFDRFGAGGNSRNSRIDSLCGLLGLEERRYTGDVTAVQRPIDYAAVDGKLAALREESRQYLADSLRRAEGN